MASVEKMKNPLYVGKAIRAQLENEIPKDLPLDRDFRVRPPFTFLPTSKSLTSPGNNRKAQTTRSQTTSTPYTLNSARIHARSSSSRDS